MSVRTRVFGHTGHVVSEVGYGMWSFDGYDGEHAEQARTSLQLAADLGCTFFDTAQVYGDGAGERLLGDLVRANPDRRIFTATKLQSAAPTWPTRRGDALEDNFPPAHIREFTLRSLENMALDRIDLLQFHGWEDAWAEDESWQKAITDLKDEGVIGFAGISINRWEPWNAIRTLETGLISSVQVIYNLFDQSPEDELFPACRELGVAVIARVPFDEGGLTGALTRRSRWPDDDWRSQYFAPDRLAETVDRVDAVKELLPPGMSLPEMALRFILSNPAVTTVIPGMRLPVHVRANLAAAAAGPLSTELLEALGAHRWPRTYEPSW